MRNILSKRFLLWVIITMAIILVAAFWIWLSSFDRLVFEVRYGEDHDVIERVARNLRTKPRAIDAALEDISLYGGNSRWAGSWILMTSPLSANIEPKLRAIAASPDQPLYRRVEALRILWVRTGDPACVHAWYELVRLPAERRGVGLGRTHLAICFSGSFMATNQAMIKQIVDVPETEPLPMTMEEFKRLTENPGALESVQNQADIHMYPRIPK